MKSNFKTAAASIHKIQFQFWDEFSKLGLKWRKGPVMSTNQELEFVW